MNLLHFRSFPAHWLCPRIYDGAHEKPQGTLAMVIQKRVESAFSRHLRRAFEVAERIRTLFNDLL